MGGPRRQSSGNTPGTVWLQRHLYERVVRLVSNGSGFRPTPPDHRIARASGTTTHSAIDDNRLFAQCAVLLVLRHKRRRLRTHYPLHGRRSHRAVLSCTTQANILIYTTLSAVRTDTRKNPLSGVVHAACSGLFFSLAGCVAQVLLGVLSRQAQAQNDE